MGPNVSDAFPLNHCRSLLCQFLSLTSLPAVTPKIEELASFGETLLVVFPMTMTNSAS